MKAKWMNIVERLQGNMDQRHYARRIPGNTEWGTVCAKPELSNKVKKAKAEHPTAKRFAELMAETKAIMHDPDRKAEWQSRYDEATRKARKYNKPIQGRLYDYIKHELSEERKRESDN
ncbi:MAG: hypothetical protein K6A36_03145 [Paludibacteraceae bacterium]|nr:hypothetical protein [Paludibacteraceae bacterium]